MSEDKALNSIVESLLAERKRDYRNKITFRVVIILLVLSLLFIAPMSSSLNYSEPHIAVIEIDGMISSDTEASASKIIPLLQQAESNEQCKVIFIKINSGGGSATQSKIIYDEINQIGVPESAVTIQGSTAFVYTVKDETAEKKNIEIGKRNFGKVSVVSGINEGDLVITEGVSKVRNNAKIKIINPRN